MKLSPIRPIRRALRSLLGTRQLLALVEHNNSDIKILRSRVDSLINQNRALGDSLTSQHRALLDTLASQHRTLLDALASQHRTLIRDVERIIEREINRLDSYLLYHSSEIQARIDAEQNGRVQPLTSEAGPDL